VRSGVLAGLAAVIVVLGVTGALLMRGTLGGSGSEGAVNGDTIATEPQSQGASADPGSVAGAGGASTDPGPSTRGVPGPSASGSSGGESWAGGTVQVPEVFAGTWSGDVNSEDGRAYTATIVLTPGESEAAWQGADGCKQRATLTQVRDGDKLDLTLEQEDMCLGGDMTLTMTGAGTLDFIGQDGGSHIDYRGELRRS
jgi:hypothetical protein